MLLESAMLISLRFAWSTGWDVALLLNLRSSHPRMVANDGVRRYLGKRRCMTHIAEEWYNNRWLSSRKPRSSGAYDAL